MREDSYLDDPHFGDLKSNDESVKSFYQYWGNFNSCKVFGFADVWDEREANNRNELRFIQKENQRERNAAKNKYVRKIKELVEFVQRFDVRY